MTNGELVAEIGEYLHSHLDNGFWYGLDEETRSAGVFTAFSDVCVRIPGLTLENLQKGSNAVKAIAEQAVFLVRNYADLTAGKIATSEGVEGISTGYTLLNGADAGFSPRAASFVQLAKREARAGGVRFTRG